MTLPAAKSNVPSLSGCQRAAILIKSLPTLQATKIVDRLRPNQLQQLFGKLKTLPQISDRQFVSVIHEFMDACTRQHAQSALAAYQTAERQSRTTTEPGNPFEFLIRTPNSVRHQLLANEHPLNVATVLSFLPPEVASTTLNSMEPLIRVSVLRRLCEIEDLDPLNVSNLAFVLNSRLRKILNLDHHQKMGVELAARLLSCTDEKTQQEIVQCLAIDAPEVACQLETSIFSFSDLLLLGDQDIKLILASVDTACWAPALKYSNLQLQKKILDNLASRPRNMLNREISEIGPIDSVIGNHAQQQVVKVCLQLHDLGKIRLPGGAHSSPAG